MSVVAVSDVHLGIDGANKDKFNEFLIWLLDQDLDYLVLLGDIIDLWRRDFTNVLVEDCWDTLDLLTDLAHKTEVRYIVGNHDYYFLSLSEIHREVFPFEVKKSTVIKSGNQEFYFIHGHQLEVLCNPYYKSMKTYEAFSENLCLAGDDIGNAADALYKMYQSHKSIWYNLKRLPENPSKALKSMMETPETRIRNMRKHNIINPMVKLAESEMRHIILGMKPEQFLIYGHTHLPEEHSAYDQIEKRVANTGSWGFGDQKKYCYIEIIDDKVDLKEFD